MIFKNGEAKGDIYYGMHMVPGVAEYRPQGEDPYRVFLDEDTIRAMDPSFAGCPLFVLHKDEIETNIDKLRREADGWVVESFFNPADGKHWVKFLVLSKSGNRAVASGMRLSNCYIADSFGAPGVWNGVDYDKKILGGSYEHLALVPDPRYNESIILTPDQFKKYNDEKTLELKRLANSSTKGVSKMKLSFFKRAKVENSADIEGTSVLLPNSQREVTIMQLINEADEREAKKGELKMVDADHHVEVNGEKMKVHDLVNAYKDCMNALEDLKKSKEDDDKEENAEDVDVDVDEDMENADDSSEDMEAKKEAEKLVEHEEKEMKEAKQSSSKKGNSNSWVIDKEKADRLKNAHLKAAEDDSPVLRISCDQVNLGKQRYGSSK